MERLSLGKGRKKSRFGVRNLESVSGGFRIFSGIWERLDIRVSLGWIVVVIESYVVMLSSLEFILEVKGGTRRGF